MAKEISLIALVALITGALFLGTSVVPAFAQGANARENVTHGELNTPVEEGLTVIFNKQQTAFLGGMGNPGVKHEAVVGALRENVPHGELHTPDATARFNFFAYHEDSSSRPLVDDYHKYIPPQK
jgi:hypothetical protein